MTHVSDTCMTCLQGRIYFEATTDPHGNTSNIVQVNLVPNCLYCKQDWTKELTHWGRISDNSARPGEGGFALWDIAGEVVRDFVPRVNDESQWELVPDMIAVKEEYEALVENSDRFLAKLGFERQGGRYHIRRKQDRQQQVAVFCHGGFGLTWLSHLLYLPLSLFWCSFW